MKLLTLVIFCALLAACGGGGSGGGSGSSFPTFSVSGSGAITTDTLTVLHDVSVSGSGNTVTIPAGTTMRAVSISGLNQDITIGAGSTASQGITISGSGNTLHYKASDSFTITDSGIGTILLPSAFQ